MAWSGQAMAAVAGQLDQGVRPLRCLTPKVAVPPTAENHLNVQALFPLALLTDGHARVFWAFGCARVFKTSRTIQNATAGQSQSGSQAREAEVFRPSEANV